MVAREQVDIAALRRNSQEAEQQQQIEQAQQRAREQREQQLRDSGYER